MKKVTKKHYVYLDLIRDLSFLFIIFYHYLHEMQLREILDTEKYGIVYSNSNMHIATLGVGLFFMISGAGLMLSSRKEFSLAEYFKKRVLKIMIPYYLAYIGCMVLLLLIRHQLPFAAEASPWTILFILLGVDGYLADQGVVCYSLGIGEWFLGCLILMYLLFPLLRKVLKKNRGWFIVIATVYYILILRFFPFETHPYTNFFVKIYEFMLGMFLLDLLKDRKPTIGIRKGMGIVSAIIVLLYLLLPFEVPVDADAKTTILCTAVFILAYSCEPLLQKLEWLKKMLMEISAWSFEIFLVHHMLIYQVGIWMNGRTVTLIVAMGVLLAEVLVMILTASVLKYLTRKCLGWIV